MGNEIGEELIDEMHLKGVANINSDEKTNKVAAPVVLDLWNDPITNSSSTSEFLELAKSEAVAEINCEKGLKDSSKTQKYDSESLSSTKSMKNKKLLIVSSSSSDSDIDSDHRSRRRKRKQTKKDKGNEKSVE